MMFAKENFQKVAKEDFEFYRISASSSTSATPVKEYPGKYCIKLDPSYLYLN
jgi:hypothetical protein